MLTKFYETIKTYLQEEKFGITVAKIDDGLSFCFQEDGSTHVIFKNEIPITAMIDPGVADAKSIIHAVKEMHEKAVKMSALIQSSESWKEHLYLRTIPERPVGVLYRKETDHRYSYLCLKMKNEKTSDYCAVSGEIFQYWWAKEKELSPTRLWERAQENVWNEIVIQAEMLGGFPVKRKYFPILEDGALNWDAVDKLLGEDSLLISVKNADAAYVALAYPEIAKYFSYLFGDDFKIVLLGGNRLCVCKKNYVISVEDIALWNSLVSKNADDYCYLESCMCYDPRLGKFCHFNLEGDEVNDNKDDKSKWREI